jgi:hypothetical protein
MHAFDFHGRGRSHHRFHGDADHCAEVLRRSVLTEWERRARFAIQTARAEFGRFYVNGELARRMQRQVEKSRRRRLEEATKIRRRKRNGAAGR